MILLLKGQTFSNARRGLVVWLLQLGCGVSRLLLAGPGPVRVGMRAIRTSYLPRHSQLYTVSTVTLIQSSLQALGYTVVLLGLGWLLS